MISNLFIKNLIKTHLKIMTIMLKIF